MGYKDYKAYYKAFVGLGMPVRDYVTPVAGLILVLFSLYMLYRGVELMREQDVASSLLATLIGFLSLSGGVTLLRTWAITRAYSVEKSEAGRSGKESEEHGS